MTDGPESPFQWLAKPELNPQDGNQTPRRSPAVAVLLMLVRLIVAAVAIRFALGKDPAHTFDSLRDADLGWALLALLCMLLVLASSALRWRSYLHAVGHINVTRNIAMRLTAIGAFFNVFLPTGVGGDAYKAMRVAPRGHRSEAFASVVLDRFSGLVGLAVVAIIAIAADLEVTPPRLLFVSEAIAVAIITATVVPRASREWVLRRAHVQDRGRIGHSLWKAASAVAQANRSLRMAVKGYAWGIVTQAALLAVHLAVAKSLGIELPYGIIAAAAVVAQMAALIPLTVNGLGFREAAYVWALTSAGISHQTGAAFALEILALMLTVSAFGGIVYLMSPARTLTSTGSASAAN